AMAHVIISTVLGSVGSASASVAALVQNTLNTMLLAKVTLPVGIGAGLLLVVLPLLLSSSKGKSSTSLFIIIQPTNQTVGEMRTAVFSVGATSAQPLTYQWRFNGKSVAGATLSTLTLSNVQGNQAGDYSVLVTGSAGSLTSLTAVLTVQPAPLPV